MVLPSARALFQRRPLLLFPVLDGLLIPLLSSALGFLQALPKCLEQTTHMSRVVAYPELSADHYSHPLTCPYLSPKAVISLSCPLQKLWHPGALVLAQARPCPGAGRRFRASTPPPSRFIHWLTAPLLTPEASAMRCWDHPSCLSSKALKRLPSRQFVASLESKLSMREILPLTFSNLRRDQ
jgi:hypothetical protein